MGYGGHVIHLSNQRFLDYGIIKSLQRTQEEVVHPGESQVSGLLRKAEARRSSL